MSLGSPQWMYKSGEAFTIDQSLKLNDGSSSRLVRTFGTPTSTKKFSFSFWFKRSQIAEGYYIGGHSQQNILSVGSSGSNYAEIAIGNNDYLYVHDYAGGYKLRYYRDNYRLHDVSAWMHILMAVDTTQSTAAERVRIYFNGVEQTTWNVATDPALNSDLGWFNDDSEWTIGSQFTHTSNFFDGYLAELHYIDGTQLTPADFGETGDYGEWKPKEVSGLTYGNNGFYLPFKADYEVEGFSATVYKGNGANRYIGGVGFQPDLTWIKMRDGTDEARIMDSVRGIPYSSKPTNTAEDNDETTGLTARNPDGFSLGSSGAYNNSSNKFVAWNWDMGGASGPRTFTLTRNGDVEHDTAQAKFGTSSLHFASSGLYIADNTSDDYFDFGTSGDFTLEGWCYRSNSGTSKAIFDIRGPTHNNYCEVWISGSGLSVSGSNIAFNTSFAPPVTTWFHVALVRSGGTAKIYVDGVEKGSDTSTGQVGGTDWGVTIGQYRTAGGSAQGEYWDGYMDEIRFSNNARYTTGFVPQSEPFGTDGNTLLLIHSDTTNGSTTIVDSGGDSRNTDGTITSNVAANPTYGQSIVSWTGTGATGTVGTGLTSDAELVIVKGRTTSDNWSISTTVIDLSLIHI